MAIPHSSRALLGRRLLILTVVGVAAFASIATSFETPISVAPKLVATDVASISPEQASRVRYCVTGGAIDVAGYVSVTAMLTTEFGSTVPMLVTADGIARAAEVKAGEEVRVDGLRLRFVNSLGCSTWALVQFGPVDESGTGQIEWQVEVSGTLLLSGMPSSDEDEHEHVTIEFRR